MNNGEPEKYDVIYGVYPWAFDCPGGGERQLMAWKCHLEARGHHIRLYDPWHPVPDAPRIFHFFSVMPGSFQLCEYLKHKGKYLLVTPNLWVTPETQWHYPHEEIKRLLKIADRVVVNSLAEVHALSEVYDIAAERFRIVYNGVEQIFFQSLPPVLFRSWTGLGEQRYLLNVANVEPRKNQLALLRALKDYPELTLVVVGYARDADYLARCRRQGGKQFCYCGPLDYASDLLRSALAGAEAFVMPSTLETPSIAALEAAASGCRIMVTQVGSTKEYFGDNVVYIDPASHASVSHGIGKVLQMSPENIRAHIQQCFSWERVILELEKVYGELLQLDG